MVILKINKYFFYIENAFFLCHEGTVVFTLDFYNKKHVVLSEENYDKQIIQQNILPWYLRNTRQRPQLKKSWLKIIAESIFGFKLKGRLK